MRNGIGGKEGMAGISLNIGDTVHYGANGVCRVSGVEQMDMGCGKKAYYLLRPVSEEQIQLYLPADADPERVKLRRVLSAQEIYALVAQEEGWQTDWMTDSKARREISGKTLRSGDTVELMRMVKAIYHHAKGLPTGKTLPMSDMEQLRNAEKQLYNEFCYVLDIQREQVIPFILGQIQVEERKELGKFS